MAKSPPTAVPIIFLPGIMGSRLADQNQQITWDPGIWDAFDDAEERKAKLIGSKFNKNFLKVAGLWGSTIRKDEKYWKNHNLTAIDGLDVTGIAQELKPTRLAAMPQPRRKRGWGGVLWKPYGEFLTTLENYTRTITQTSGNCHVYMPIYAHGYNWTASNVDSGKQLATTIDAAKAEMAQLGLPCEKVMLITHSMGGFVARACSEIWGKRSDIYGICHLAMPDNGSPATYKRMKAGFEGSGIVGGIIKKVLGSSGQNVTAVLGHAPGGLELLPNAPYRKENGQQDCWLTLEDDDDRVTLFNGSAESVYKEPLQWWRLINPDWLYPENPNLGIKNFKSEFVGNTLDQALRFHNAIGETKHPNTWMIYSTGHAAWDKIQWKFQKKTVVGSRGGASVSNESDIPTKELVSFKNHSLLRETGTGQVTFYHTSTPNKNFLGFTQGATAILASASIKSPTADGDGTVHLGAGKFASGAKKQISIKASEEHQDMVINSDVEKKVNEFIKTILRDFANCSF